MKRRPEQQPTETTDREDDQRIETPSGEVSRRFLLHYNFPRMRDVAIHPCTGIDQPGWLALRVAFLPHSARNEHLAEMTEMLQQPGQFIQFLGAGRVFSQGAVMQTCIVLFRGINVGGNNKLPMKELIAVLEGLGLRDIRTYIQSGNVVCSGMEEDKIKLAARISAALVKSHGRATKHVWRVSPH